MSKSVLVTGAAGFIGSHLIDALLEKGHRVIGIDNFRTGNLANLRGAMSNDRFDFLKQDICDNRFLNSFDDEIDLIFHLAAISSVKLSIENSKLVNHVNVSGTINVLELARHSKTSKLIFTSSAAVYGNPGISPIPESTLLQSLSPYAASKIAAEQYTTAYSNSYGIDSTILRLFNIYGPRQAYSEYSGVISIFINRMLNGDVLKIEGDGEQTRSFVYVKDLVDALLIAAEIDKASNKIINISGDIPISVLDITKYLNSISSRDVEIEHVAPRPGDVCDSLGATELAKQILNFTPKVSFEEGLRKTYEWYQSQT
jgi:UDP-glucose 4-epimerase